MKRKGKTSMDRAHQIRQMWKQGYSQNKIAESLKMCPRTVKKFMREDSLSSDNSGKEAELSKDLPSWLKALDHETLVKQAQKGVSIKVLYDECKNLPVKYWSFWKTISNLAKENAEPVTTIRLNHKPGEKTFIDYTDGLDIYDIPTNTIIKTQLFVGTLPFSSKVYAEFSYDQKLPSFIQSHERMWTYFGGVTPYTVTDNLKSSVTKADLYDPDKNKTFTAYANHAGFAVLPARPRKPKDKANVECHAGLLQRTFFQEVRDKTFTSLAELNESLWDFLERLNNQVMKDHGVSRNERFEVEVTCLQPLPTGRFEIPEVKEATVHPDCHIQFGRSFYSVPYRYVGQKVRVIGTYSRVSVYDLHTLEKIASHSPAKKNGERRTDELHWPPQKKEHCDFNIEKAKWEAQKIGPTTTQLIEKLFSMPHPLQYLRRVQGWVRLVSHGRATRESMEYASKMALQHNKFSSNYIKCCAEFHENGGLQRVGMGAPKREIAFSYLQK